MGNKKNNFIQESISILKNRKFLVLLIVSCLAIILYYIISSKPQIKEPIPTVEVLKIEQNNVSIYGEYVGRIRAHQFVEVRARVEGYLEKMLFNEGSAVVKDQPLFIIDPTTYKAKVEKARALSKKDEAQVLKARRDYERIKPLFEQNAVSQLDLDNAEAAYESAKATLEMSKADLIQAELQLSYTKVKSPITGRISQRNADLGTLVGPSNKSLLATVVKSDTVLVDFSLTDLDYLRSKKRNVNLGSRDSTRSWQPNVTITMADQSVYPEKGYVDFAEPQVDPNTGTFGVRAQIPNPNGALLPGQSTRVQLLLDVMENVVSVPQKAIITEKGGAYIYVINKDSIAKKIYVELGPQFDNNVVVERGLREGELIVAEGHHKLTPNMKVRIAEPSKNIRKEEE